MPREIKFTDPDMQRIYCACHARYKEDFERGMIAALAVVAAHDEGVIYKEIVASMGAENIYRVAKKDGALRWIKWRKYYKRENPDLLGDQTAGQEG